MVLDETYNIDQGRIECLTKSLASQLEPFERSRNQGDLRPTLREIITKASELGAMVAQAKPNYIPGSRDLIGSSESFTEHTMETPCEKVEEGSRISLLITPALVK